MLRARTKIPKPTVEALKSWPPASGPLTDSAPDKVRGLDAQAQFGDAAFREPPVRAVPAQHRADPQRVMCPIARLL